MTVIKKQKTIIVILLLGILVGRKSLAQQALQTGEPIVGQPCPNFSFTKVDFYKKSTVTLNDFKGKWLVLDFWSKDCSGCIGGFPTISERQKILRDSLQYLMVAPDDKEGENRIIYTKYHNRLHLMMPGAFIADSVFFKQFNVGLLPHVVIIDPLGTVRAVTGPAPIEKLRLLMKGENPAFSIASYADDKDLKEKFKYDNSAPFLVNGNGGPDSNFLFRSLLSKWVPGTPYWRNGGFVPSEAEIKVNNNKGRFEAIGVDLALLYRAAYLGRTEIYKIAEDSTLNGGYWPNPILELRDSSLFKPDYASGDNVFCYSLVVPPSRESERFMMKIMQSDLDHYFGYKVNMELRSMPVWRLIATDDAKVRLRSKGGERSVTLNKEAYFMRNAPFERLKRLIEVYSGVTSDGTPMLDETGINENIDFVFDCLVNEFDCVRLLLRKNGLDLVKDKKVMKVIVIKDSDAQRDH